MSNSIVIQNIKIESRDSDNFINATQLCKAGDKRFSNWYQLDSTKELINELEIKLKTSNLIDIKKENSKKFTQGTWIHPLLVTHLAIWISPKFVVKVSQWIEEWKNYSLENKNKYQYELEHLEPSHNILREKELQAKYKNKLNAEIEVKTPVGYIDLLTDNKLIELKTAINWKHGIGQLICYGTYYEEYDKWLYLFDYEDLSETDIDNIELICKNNDIGIKYID